MKRANNPGARLLALLLAVVLVAGMLPAQVIAEGTADVLSAEVRATVTATPVEGQAGQFNLEAKILTEGVAFASASWIYEEVVTAPAEPDGSQEGAEGTEGTEGVEPEPSKLVVKNETTSTTEFLLDTATKTIKGVEILTADGRYITVDLSTVTAEEASGSWTATLSPKTAAIYAGVKFAAPAAEDVTAGAVKDLSWNAEIAGTYNTEADGAYSGKAKDDTVTFTYKLQKQDQSVTVCTLQKTFTVGETPAPTYTISPALTAGDNYFAADQTVSITAELEHDYVTAPEKAALPNAFGKDWTAVEGSTNTWTAEASFTAAENEGKEYAFAFNGADYKLVIDKVVPTINNVGTYQEGGKWYTAFTYTVGASGLQTATVNGAAAEIPQEGDKITFAHSEKPTEDVQIVITNGANVTASSTGTVAGDFAVAYTATGLSVGADGETWYGANGTIIATVTAPKDVTFSEKDTVISGKNAENDSLTAEWTQVEGADNQWKCEISTNKGISVLSITPAGTLENGAVHQGTAVKYGVTIACDKDEPQIGNLMVGEEKLANGYYGSKTTVTLTVQDVLLNTTDSVLTYTVDGGQKTTDFALDNGVYVASFTLTNEQTLTNVAVYAEDMAGNEASQTFKDLSVKVDIEAPEVSFTASGNVTGFYQAADRKYYAILENPVHSNEDAATEEVFVTATVTDWSLDKNLYLEADGWTISQDGTEATKTFVAEVGKNEVQTLSMAVTAVDMAGHMGQDADLVLATQKAGQVTTSVPMTAVDGVYTQSIQVDRRTPEDADNAVGAAPMVTLKDANGNTNIGDILYSSVPTFTFAVTDSGAGINEKSISAEVNNGVGNQFLAADTGTVTKDNAGTVTGTIVITEKGEGNETNSAGLTLDIADNVGNIYHYATNLKVDTKDPVIAVDRKTDEQTGSNTVLNVDYYNGNVSYTISVTDLNLVEAQLKYTVDGNEETENLLEEGNNPYTFTLTHGQKLTGISVTAKDAANRSNAYNDATQVEVDKTAPVITLVKTVEEGKGSNTVSDVDYYNGEVTYTVKAEDENLASAQLTYTIDNETTTVDLAKDTEASFTVTDGKKLTAMTLTALDNAQNPATVIADEDQGTRTDFTYDEKTKIHSYNANPDVVDKTAPVVEVVKTVEKDKKYIQTVDGVDYYNGKVTYTINVTDDFLTTAEFIAVAAKYQQEEVSVEMAGENGEYTGTIIVDDEKVLEGITIQVLDNAQNPAEDVTENDADEKTQFVYKDKVNTYNANKVAVDTVNPQVEIDFGDNVSGVYANENTPDVVYVKLDPAVVDENAKKAEATLTITASDKNLTSTKGILKVAAGEGDNGVGTEVFDEESGKFKVVYTQKAEVAADKLGAIVFALTVTDMAGNPLLSEGVSYKDMTDRSVVPDGKLPVNADGCISGTIAIDRRRPTSTTGDNTAPQIIITPSVKSVGTATNGVELFNAAFTYALSVNDGKETDYNSGINKVVWSINDNGVVTTVANSVAKEAAGTYEKSYQIPVNIVNGIGETNDAVLTISATDNVGNTITYEKALAVDNEKPRVNVVYNNDSVQNEKYFKADRIATITVEDINFNPAATTVDTQVSVSGWTSEGAVHTASAAYTVDGEYTLALQSVDLAGNVTLQAEVTSPSAAPWDFVLDKTAPVINVSYNPSQPVGKDDKGVSFYAQELGVSVNIEEVNFNSGEVNADFKERNRLGAWRSSGSSHTASATFGEGNEYSFTINYTDLAGNPAVTYTSDVFSVDMTAPTIEISQGTMTTEEMNIVQGDLVLGFTINDAQDNLADFSVKVTQLNNEFKTVEVSGSEYFTLSNVGNRTTGYINMTNIEKLQENEGIYIVNVDARDYAGNTVSLIPELVFSLNRFGSTFMAGDEFTASFLTPSENGTVYQNSVSDTLVLKEINPNRVWQDDTMKEEGASITITVNGNATVLTKGTDYTMDVAQEGTGTNRWMVYTYTISTDCFIQNEETVDGSYAILLYSHDDAGNKNTNESNAGTIQTDSEGKNSGKIQFTLDHKDPIITILGIQEGDSLDAAFKRVEINVSDNTPTAIAVLLNDKAVPLSETMEGLGDDTVWLALDPATGNYILNIVEENFVQNLKVSAQDAAENASEQEVADFLVTSNAFIRAINNPWIVGGTVTAVLAAGVVIFLAARKKKKAAA